MVSKKETFLNNQQGTFTISKLKSNPTKVFLKSTFLQKERNFSLSLGNFSTLKENQLDSTKLVNCQKGPSETTREATLNSKFSCSQKFLEWFIGFVEKDECFKIQNSSQCFFSLQFSEPAVLFKIKNQRKMGSVHKVKKKNLLNNESVFTEQSLWDYRISAKKDLFKLIHLFNGKILLEKNKEMFQKWFEVWKTQMGLDFPPVSLKTENYSSSTFLNNGWLSGFIDGNGLFNIQVQKHPGYSTGYRVRLRWILVHQNFHNLWPILENLFPTGHFEQESPAFKEYWRLTDLKTLPKIFDYLKSYPLHTLKRIHFHRFKKTFLFILEKKHLKFEGLHQIKRWKTLSQGNLD